MQPWSSPGATAPSPTGLSGGLVGGSLNGLVGRLANLIVNGWFKSAVHVVASLAQWSTVETWKSLSASTEPVMSGHAFGAEFDVMWILGVAVILPMLCLGIVQSVARQDGSSLLRTALIRMPFAILFTAVAVKLVSLSLSATDEASAALLSAAGDPARRLFTSLATDVVSTSVTGAGIGAALLLAGSMAAVAFVLWVELAVRSAAVAAATLFLPLALAGLAWPATTQWARRLGETIAGLVLMKLVIAGVLALAATAIGGHSGTRGVVEGVALLVLATLAPFALLRLIPMIEAGAVSHLEGAHHRTTGMIAAAAANATKNGWLSNAGAFSEPERALGPEASSPSRIGQIPEGLRSGPAGAPDSAGGAGSDGNKAARKEARAVRFQREIDNGPPPRDDAA